MDTYIDIVKIIAPEMQQTIERRYILLRTVSHLAPVGRRMLADAMGLGERIVRSELSALRQLGLIESGSGGVVLTDQGQELLQAMLPHVKEMLGLPRLERQVATALAIPRVVVVPGNSQSDPLVKRELGRAAARLLTKLVHDGDVVAITGGTTMAHVAEAATPVRRQVVVVPGRGALGERVEIQANTIAACLAKALGGKYRLLHAPDNLTSPAMEELLRDPGIAEVLALIRQTTVLIHGIGSALEMAVRRNATPGQLDELKRRGAVAEALGYYFNDQGEIVWQANSIGLRRKDLAGIKTVMAVAGGADKARAIRAVVAHIRQHVLVTDQGAAEAILTLPPL